MKDVGVAAIIVTYERKELLRTCLEAVLGQTRPPSFVLVVNNASSDGTREMLDNEYGDRVSRIHMKENVGGAGAYYLGMKWAFENGVEWFWMMDDDGEPCRDSLEKLLETAISKDYALLNPLIISPDDPERLAFPPRIKGRSIDRVHDILSYYASGGIVENYLSPFNGTMIHRKVVRSVGYPRREMFIWGDEMDYLYRVERSGEKYATLCAARHIHPRWKNKQSPILRTFTLVRPEVFDSFVRNLGYLAARYRGPVFRVAKPLSYVLSFLLKGDLAGMRKFLSYWFDGTSDRYELAPSRKELIAKGENYVFQPATLRSSADQAAR